jgi:hypothetical protein
VVETLLLRWTLLDRVVDLEAVLAGGSAARRLGGPAAGGTAPDRPSDPPPPGPRAVPERGDVLASAEPPGRRAPEPSAEPVLDVRDLVYRGRRALERALELRADVAGRLAEGQPAERWRPLLDELFDLLPLATEDA